MLLREEERVQYAKRGTRINNTKDIYLRTYAHNTHTHKYKHT